MKSPAVSDLINLASLARYAGLALCFLGGFILLGWAIGIEVMVRVLPNSTAMTINTALMFLATGLCLCLGSRETGRASRTYRLLPLFLIFLSSLILGQHIYDVDLGIDLSAFHQVVGDGHGKPGRTAPNACLGFLFLACVFILTRQTVPRAGAYRISLLLSIFTFLIGATAFLGYWLDLDALYQIASYNRMAALTSLGMSIAGIGAWALSLGHKPYGLAASLADARQITGLAAGLLTVFAVAAGMTVFGILKTSYERSAIERIGHSAKTAALSVSSLLDKANLLSRSVSSRPSLSASLAVPENDESAERMQSILTEEGFRFLSLDFSSVQIFDGRNELRLSVGRPVENAETTAEAVFDASSDRSQLL